MRPTSVTRLFGIEAPVVLGAFGGVSSVELTATVSEAGGLGSYGLYGYDGERILATAAALRARTDGPFALNIWLPTGDEVGVEGFDAHPLAVWFEELGLDLPAAPARYLPPVEEQVAAVLEARPAVLSTVFGVPDRSLVERAHAVGTLVVGTATTVEEAVALDAGGVDAIVATGMEAGGHRVSFLRAAEDSLVGTLPLVPQVVDAVSVPVIAAGGIADARGLAAVLALGAGAAQVGSAFLATRQSAASPGYRAALRGEAAGRTVLTRAMSGRLARGIPNRVMAGITQPAPFPAQNWLTGRFRAVAAERDLPELLSLWAGQASPLIREDDAAALVRALVAGLPD